MTLPNLIGCGAGKSGTTSIYYYLSQHPQIYMAVAKELHFFSQYFAKGSAWYESHFSGGAAMPVIGEFSTSYMLDTAVPARIADLTPEANLLFVFRDPIERAYSNYWFSISIGTQDRDKSFSDVIHTLEGYKKYIESGFYYQHLSRFLDYFPPQQIYVMITEEIKEKPIQQMAKCYEFLGVDSTFQPDVNQQYNVTVTTPNKWLGSAYTTWMMAKKQIKPVFKRFPVTLRRNLAQLEKIAVRRVMSEERPPIQDLDLAFLTEIFAEQNNKLAQFIGRELSCWH